MNASDLKKKQSWKVQSDGDIEGRTINDHGVFWGNFLEIITALGEKQFYNLHLFPLGQNKTESKKLPKPSSIPKEIHVAIYSFSSKEDFLEIAKEAFPDANFELSNFYQSIKFTHEPKVKKHSLNKPNKTENSEIRKIALAKLTDEEKKVLGLK